MDTINGNKKCFLVLFQPPKKNAGTKGAKGKMPKITDGSPAEELSKEQVLMEQNSYLREELDRERKERNYFQLERDKIHSFWDITKKQLEEKKADLLNRDKEIEEVEVRHQAEIKVYKQKVKHLLYEHQDNISELKAGGVVATKLLQQEHNQQDNELRKTMRTLKMDFKEQELSNENLVKSLKLKHDEEITTVRKDFERQVREIEAKYEKKMQVLRQELDLQRKSEIHEVEERKNSQTDSLMKSHEQAFSDIKNYYKDITHNNLALINSLKEQMEDMKKKVVRREKQKAEVQQQNKRLTESLQEATDELGKLKNQVAYHEKDKTALAVAKARLKAAEKEIKDLKWERDVLEQNFNKVQAERDELYQNFSKAILEVQQKSGLKNQLLECKLSTLTDNMRSCRL
uniref:Dynein regulatory complex subunit 4 n=1 Tax=Scleropages formosus TaxID=113540 RepID=A0A8C9V0D6_SCLFO